MNAVRPNMEACSRITPWACGRAFFWMTAVLAGSNPAMVMAQADSNLVEEIPPLRPPRGELPPGFMEQYGNSVLIGVAVGLVLMLLAIWWLTSRRAVPAPPPERIARQALAELQTSPEDGLLLSRVSQIVRRYYRAAFELAPGESTTTEFCAELAGNERVGETLAEAVGVFLRQCDERKFAPVKEGPGLNALNKASELVDAGESRRAALRAAAAKPTQERVAQ